jgi:hypothetical protein
MKTLKLAPESKTYDDTKSFPTFKTNWDRTRDTCRGTNGGFFVHFTFSSFARFVTCHGVMLFRLFCHLKFMKTEQKACIKPYATIRFEAKFEKKKIKVHPKFAARAVEDSSSLNAALVWISACLLNQICVQFITLV